jgi:hypothetical protein
VYPKEEIDGFEQYWRRRKPGRSTAIHYRSDVSIFFQWTHKSLTAVTMHHVDRFIDSMHSASIPTRMCFADQRFVDPTPTRFA